MREIKFRAWDIDEKKMLGLFDLPDWFNTLSLFNGKEGIFFIPLQYTDLTDKNGKEIWEGDIMTNGDTGVVKYIKDRFVAVDKNDKEMWNLAILSSYTPEPKVIGNIYENKDLLK